MPPSGCSLNGAWRSKSAVLAGTIGTNTTRLRRIRQDRFGNGSTKPLKKHDASVTDSTRDLTVFNTPEPCDIEQYSEDLRHAFLLGVEWEMFRRTLTAFEGPLAIEVDRMNMRRLAEMCNRHRREVNVANRGDETVTLLVGEVI